MEAGLQRKKTMDTEKTFQDEARIGLNGPALAHRLLSASSSASFALSGLQVGGRS